MPLLWNTVAATSIDLERHDGFQASGGRHRRTLPRYSCQVAYPRNKVVDYPNLGKFARATHEFATYIADNAASLINYGERFRAGERISSCLAESAVSAATSKRSPSASRCNGRHAARTYCCKLEPGRSTARSGRCSSDGIRTGQRQRGSF